MTYDEFTDKFKKQVTAISYERQLNFAIEICLRLLPEYKSFNERSKFGNFETLQKAIETLKRSTPISENELKNMISEIDKMIPNIDDYSDGSYALNASASVYEALQFVRNKNPEHIFNIGTLITDTVDFKIQENQDLTEEEIEKHLSVIEVRNFLLKETEPKT